jgi:hypothetical protein
VNNWFEGGEGSLQQVVPLGTSTVTTQTKVIGSIAKYSRVTGIRFYGQDAVTATSLTAEVFARTKAGATGLTLQASATDIEFASEAIAKAGVVAVIASEPNVRLLENQLIEVVVTADTCSAGPGDLLVEVELSPYVGRG